MRLRFSISAKTWVTNSVLKWNKIEMKKCIDKFSCPKCPKKFNSKCFLKNHMYDSHSRTGICSLCLLTLKRKGSLRRHMLQWHRRHVDEKVCAVCGKLFSKTEYLRKTEIKFNKEKIKMSWQYCEKEFSSKQNLATLPQFKWFL